MFVFGGTNGSDYFGDFFSFSIKGNKWESLSNDGAPSARAFHSTTQVNGKIYIFGGNDGKQHFDDLHSYDPC